MYKVFLDQRHILFRFIALIQKRHLDFFLSNMNMVHHSWLLLWTNQVASIAKSTFQTECSPLNKNGVLIKELWHQDIDAAIAHTKKLLVWLPRTLSDSSAQLPMYQPRITLEFQLIWVSISILDKEMELEVHLMLRIHINSSTTLVQTDWKSCFLKSVMKELEISWKKLKLLESEISKQN